MANLVEAIQRKFEAIYRDEIDAECKLKSSSPKTTKMVSSRVITMDNQEISSVGDPREIISVFENMNELDLSTNRICLWSEIFTILECAPQLQILNLSYNPLNTSTLFCEMNNALTSHMHGDFIHSSTYSASDDNSNLNYNIDLIAELSFQEETDETCEDESGKHLRSMDSICRPCLSHQLATLVLNSTRVPWQRVLTLLGYLPSLNTLHTALNDYDSCCNMSGSVDSCASASQLLFPKLTHLFFSENQLRDWNTVCCLGRHFPSLKHLVLLGNPIAFIHCEQTSSEGNRDFVGRNGSDVFKELTDLNLTETAIDSWESIDALTSWMPALLSLRLGKALPLFKQMDTQTARSEVIARMSSLTSYNSTAISQDERERAERDFVRRFGQISVENRPQRYWDLESQHGQVAPLAIVDLTPKRAVNLRVRLGDKEVWHTFCVRKSICKVKKELCGLFNLDERDAKRIRLFYLDQGMVGAQGPEEMKMPHRLLYTYQPDDGDGLDFFLTPISSAPRKTLHQKRAAARVNTVS